MNKKLPLFSDVFDRTDDARELAARTKKPSVDAARTRLGGRPSEVPPPSAWAPGTAVVFTAGGDAATDGVVLWAGPQEAHVMIDGSRLKRVVPTALALREEPPVGELAKIASDARMFAMLTEGQAVRYADEGGVVRDGSVVEKCRYGALVLRKDGAVVAVGFRKLFPAPNARGSGSA